MSNTYKVLDCTNSQSFAATLKEALVEKYGDNVTIHDETTRVVFSCPALSDKYICISRSGSWYGDELKSDGTLQNQSIFMSDDSSYGTYKTSHLVMGDSFVFITGSATNNYFAVTLVAKTEGGKSIVYGAVNNTSSFTVGKCNSIDLTNNLSFGFVDFCNSAMCSTNTPFKTKLLMSYDNVTPNPTGGTLMLKSDGTPDTIKDLYMSTFSNKSNSEYRAVSNALFSARRIYTNNSTEVKLLSSIVAEF